MQILGAGSLSSRWHQFSSRGSTREFLSCINMRKDLFNIRSWMDYRDIKVSLSQNLLKVASLSAHVCVFSMERAAGGD